MDTVESQLARARVGSGESVLVAVRPAVEAWRKRDGLALSMRRAWVIVQVAGGITRFVAAGLTALMLAQTFWRPLASDAFLDWATAAWALILGMVGIGNWNLKRLSAFERVSGLMRKTVFALTQEAVYVIVEGGETDRYEMASFRQIEIGALDDGGSADVAFRRPDGETLLLPAVPAPSDFVSAIHVRS